MMLKMQPENYISFDINFACRNQLFQHGNYYTDCNSIFYSRAEEIDKDITIRAATAEIIEVIEKEVNEKVLKEVLKGECLTQWKDFCDYSIYETESNDIVFMDNRYEHNLVGADLVFWHNERLYFFYENGIDDDSDIYFYGLVMPCKVSKDFAKAAMKAQDEMNVGELEPSWNIEELKAGEE